MKVWFDQDCEIILSTLQDICFTCEEMYCGHEGALINEVKQHRQYGCKLEFVEQSWITTIKLKKREKDGMVREATRDDVEQTLLKHGLTANLAYGVARIIPLEHKVIRKGGD